MNLTRRLGNADWDAALRATGVVGIAAIPLVLLVPRAEALVMLVLAVLWLRSPAAAFSMIGLEPLLMLYGRLYPVWLVVLVATAASVVVEIISLHVMRGVMAMKLLERVRGHVRGSRLMRLFARRPAAAVALAAFSPIPDWVTRSIGAVAGYPIGRYVAADTLGRLPKIWIPVALGSVIVLPGRWLLAVSAGSIVLGAFAAVVHYRLATRPRRAPTGRATWAVAASVLALIVAGCGRPLRCEPITATAHIGPREQVTVFHGRQATRLHGVRLGPDSLSGVPFFKPPGCDSCRVAIPRAQIDSVGMGGVPEEDFIGGLIIAVPLTIMLITGLLLLGWGAD